MEALEVFRGKVLGVLTVIAEHKQKAFMLAGPIVGLPMFLIGLDHKIASTAYIAIWMGTGDHVSVWQH